MKVFRAKLLRPPARMVRTHIERCSGKRSDGLPCNSPVSVRVGDRGYCGMHSPDAKAKRDARAIEMVKKARETKDAQDELARRMDELIQAIEHPTLFGTTELDSAIRNAKSALRRAKGG